MNESITGLDEGYVLGLKNRDLVVSTYAGKVACYSHEVKSNIGEANYRYLSNTYLREGSKEDHVEIISDLLSCNRRT